jgi:hypothetical protein
MMNLMIERFINLPFVAILHSLAIPLLPYGYIDFIGSKAMALEQEYSRLSIYYKDRCGKF